SVTSSLRDAPAAISETAVPVRRVTSSAIVWPCAPIDVSTPIRTAAGVDTASTTPQSGHRDASGFTRAPQLEHCIVREEQPHYGRKAGDGDRKIRRRSARVEREFRLAREAQKWRRRRPSQRNA